MSEPDSGATPKRHIGYVDGLNVAVSICLTYTLGVTALRVYIRRRLYGWDDAVVACATVFILGVYAASYVSLSNGLGKELKDVYLLPNSELGTLNRSIVARVIVFIITLYLSKASVVAFLARTTKTKKHHVVHGITFVLLGLLGLGSVIAVTVDCGNPSKYFFWDLRETAQYCPSQTTRWTIVMALDVSTEVVLALLPIHLMWDLQMATKKKLMIIAAFYVRLPVIAFSVVGNYIAITKYPFERDPGLAGALITIWQVVEVAYSLAAVTISASKSFADAFATGFGWGDTFREVGNSQYMLDSAASRSRTAPSRGPNSHRASGDFGSKNATLTSRTMTSDRKNISPMVTISDGDDDQINEIEKNELAGKYHQNDYNYGRPRTQGSDQTKTGSARGSWKKKDLVGSQSDYVDPLECDNENIPMKLRPERKLRNTAIIEHDPSVSSFHRRPQGEGSIESGGTDDMYIVRNVDYSVRYDEAPILDQHQRRTLVEQN